MRHVEVHQLWLQDKVAEGIIRLIKIPGTGNQVDILTKHVHAQILGIMWNRWDSTSVWIVTI